MKRLSIIAVCFATLAMASCSMFNSSSNSVAQGLGQTCGSAVLGLYQSYKNTGSVTLTEPNNLSNALTLAACYTQLSQNKDNSSYRKSFANGLILSSAGLITNQNAATFVNALLGASALGTISSTSSNSEVKKTTGTVTGLLQSLDSNSSTSKTSKTNTNSTNTTPIISKKR